MPAVGICSSTLMLLVSSFGLLMVYGDDFAVNVAYRKPANQSTTYSGDPNYKETLGFPYTAFLAVDGNKATDFHQNSCSHTRVYENNPWWEVDLQGIYNVTMIQIYRRTDANQDWLEGFNIEGKVEGSYQNIATNVHYEINGEIPILHRVEPKREFSRIRIVLHKESAAICLCEVEAYAVITCNVPEIDPTMGTYTCTHRVVGECSYNSTLTILCNEGYKLSGENSSQCLITGQWSKPIGQCEVITCNVPEIDPAMGTYTCTHRVVGECSYNSTLTIHCNEGYKLSGENSSQCLITGQWSKPIGQCEVSTCNFPEIDPIVGTYTCTQRVVGKCSYNSMLTIHCNEGYKLSGENSSQCLDTGQWSTPIVPCEVMHCDELSQPNNSIIVVHGGINGSWTYNTTVSISCNESYSLNGESLVRCVGTKQWNGSIGQCDKIADSMNSVESGSAVLVAGTAGGGAAAACVVAIGIIIGVILYRRKSGPQAKTAETAFDDLPSSSEKITHEERGTKQKVIYSQPMKRKDHVSSEADHVYKNIGDKSGDYYSYQLQNIKDKHTIELEDLSSFFLSRKLEPQMFEEEYNTLPQGLLKPHFTALLPENQKKNRYKNMYAYDDTRVQLEIWDPVTETDYINACYVNGFKDFRAYIASQGPTKDILNDFWRMIWQTKSSKIVMLTNLIEEEKHKCEKYWPDEGSIKFGFITIRLVLIETFSDFTIRTLELKKEHFVKEKGKVEPRLVTQFHFTAWPDKGVPRYASSLVHFRQKVRNTRVRGSADGPMVVHCSAGIGRTGTFLALDYLVDEKKELGYINVFRCVETLRKQRVNLVQTVEQYVFLHEALVEALSCITSAMSTSNFHVEYKKLLGIDAKTRKRRLDLQYEKLPMYVAEAKGDVYANAKSMEHRGKNRYSNILPDQNHSPYLNIDVKGCETYINAVFLPAYKDNDIFIITQTPLEDTKVDFWRMVYQFEVSSIVMLNTLKEMKDEERYWPENEESLEISPFRITLESKSVDEICVKYTFVLQYHGDHRKVRLSRATYWADNDPVPKSPTEMLKQIKLIQSWQQETGNKPIIVHCMNGAERSGLFCVVAALLERTKIEQDVAVEQIIKQMRSRRPQVIPNVDQFKFCYDAVLAFMDLYEEYSNFTQL